MLVKLWRPTKWILLVLLVLFLLFLLMFVVETAVWQVLDLLIVPVILALGAWFLSNQSNNVEREIAKDRQQQALLDAYLDRMTELILDKGLKKDGEENEAEVKTMARTHTISVLRNLDGKRKGQVLSFLHEAELIKKPSQPPHNEDTGNPLVQSEFVWEDHQIINLATADLSHADLIFVPLKDIYKVGSWSKRLITKFVEEDFEKYSWSTTKSWKANLSNAYLKDANLPHVAFVLAELWGTNLDEANLSGAILALANLSGVNLRAANLVGADLRKANLSGAALDGAELKGANLKGATVTDEQLKSARSLEDAILPNGEKYYPDFFKKAK